jgi:hypothetical protein
LDKLFKFFNLAPDFFRSKVTWLSAFMLVYVVFKYSQHLISPDQLFTAIYTILFGASLRDAIGKVLPALQAGQEISRGSEGQHWG